MRRGRSWSLGILKLAPLVTRRDAELAAVFGDGATRDLHAARRTVAKYRGELGIASSYQRRKFQDSQ